MGDTCYVESLPEMLKGLEVGEGDYSIRQSLCPQGIITVGWGRGGRNGTGIRSFSYLAVFVEWDSHREAFLG